MKWENFVFIGFFGQFYTNLRVKYFAQKDHFRHTLLEIDVKECVDLESKCRESKSFMIRVDTPTRDKIMDPNLWPEEIFIRKIHTPRRSQNINFNNGHQN